MNERGSFGFIGFGEAGYEIAKGLHGEGVARMFLCHRRSGDRQRSLLIQKRAVEAGARYLETVADVVVHSDVIFSVVPPAAAVDAAKEAAPHLKAGKLYLDLTSSFPGDMKTVETIVRSTGAKFVDGALMAAAPAFKHKVLIYVSGENARDASERLNQCGMNLKPVGNEAGQASAAKLILSIVTKGFGALLTEMLRAAHHYRLEGPVVEALLQFYPRAIAVNIDRSVGSSAIFAGRRVTEMEAAERLLEEIGVDPIMTRATVESLKWFASLKLDDYFAGVVPAGYREIVEAWDKTGLFDKLEKSNLCPNL